MSDPLPSDATPSPDADREARIEELLLSGLDHYFAGQYERAISVWTRVVFLERHHDRARAYIERARSAMAERQRESEELLASGVAAYNAGEVERARELLTRAVDQGNDTAHVFLDRLSRVGGPVAAPSAAAAGTSARRRPAAERLPLAAGGSGWLAAGVVAILVAAAMLVGGLPIGAWLSDLQGVSPPAVTESDAAEPLPVVRASETALARARELRTGGHLWDALRALDRIDLADPLRGEADQLRAEIQRDLLAASGVPAPDTRP